MTLTQMLPSGQTGRQDRYLQHDVVALRENGAERQGSWHTGLVEGSSAFEGWPGCNVTARGGFLAGGLVREEGAVCQAEEYHRKSLRHSLSRMWSC